MTQFREKSRLPRSALPVDLLSPLARIDRRNRIRKRRSHARLRARAFYSAFVSTPLRCFGNSEVLHLSSFRDKVVSSFADYSITIKQRLKNYDIVSAGILNLVINHRMLIIITISQKYLKYCLCKNNLFTRPAAFIRNLQTKIPVEKNRIVDRSCFVENRN